MATYGGAVIDESFKAAVDLSSYQYHFVKCGSVAGEITYAQSGCVPMPIGILQNDPTAGQEAVVRLFGISKCAASGALDTGAGSAITYGDPITAAGSTAKGYHTSTCLFGAIALEALAINIGGTIKVLVVGPGARLAKKQ